jgi:very-short-patch-repair endonuclease
MAARNVQSAGVAEVLELAGGQHGVVTRAQLLQLGWSEAAVKHAVDVRRLHQVRRGVFAAGRPGLDQHGEWMAAVLSCGPSAVLSHSSAAAAWGIERVRKGPVEISMPLRVRRRHAGLRIHRRGSLLVREQTTCHGIPITSPAMTILDLASQGSWARVERAVNEADVLDLIDPDQLREALRRFRTYPGVAKLRVILDRHEFVLTRNELEWRFNRIARSAGLPLPLHEEVVNGYEVDFFWPDLGLVVETDGLRYHRTPAAQARDRRRDQAHVATGLTPLRFTHHQVRFQPGYVRTRLMQTARHLRRRQSRAA